MGIRGNLKLSGSGLYGAVTTEKHLGVQLTVSRWWHVTIGIATRHLMQASKIWEKDSEDEEDRAEEDFVEGMIKMNWNWTGSGTS